MSLLAGQSLNIRNCPSGTYYSILRGNQCVPFFTTIPTTTTPVEEAPIEVISPINPVNTDTSLLVTRQRKNNIGLYVIIAMVAIYIGLVLYRNYKAGTLPKLKINSGEQRIKTYGFSII